MSTSVTRIPPLTTASASRTVPTTLAEVITMIIEDGDLKPKSRQELASAVRVICRLFGFPPAEVPADPALLRRRLEPLTPTATGMRPGSLRNLKSLFNKALTLTDITETGKRSLRPMSPLWHDLLTRIPDCYERSRLSRLAR